MFADKQTVLDAFNFRHACKSYDASKKISAEDFDFILESARLSPSSFGLEPWRFLVIQNPELRGEIRDISWGASKIMDCSHFVILLARTQQAMQADYQRRIWGGVHHIPSETIEIMEKFFKNFSERDFAITENPRTFHDWACKQTYIALANMMTGAALIGIGSCPIEGFHYRDMDALLSGAGLYDTAEWGISVAATFGYRAGEVQRKARREFDDVVQWVE